TPISPVEQTATSIAPMPSASAVASAVRWVSPKPSGPVHALAPPEFRITARSRPSVSTCSDQITGAALTRLLVNRPAASYRGPLLITRARSGLPVAFNPQAVPAAWNPFGVVTLTGPPPPRTGRWS